MTDVSKALQYYLANNSGMAAVEDDRVYSLILPQGATWPATVFQNISETRIKPHNEASNLPYSVYQFTLYANTLDDIVLLEAALMAALDGYKGQFAAGQPFAVYCEFSTPTDRREDFDQSTGIFQLQRDFQIMTN